MHSPFVPRRAARRPDAACESSTVVSWNVTSMTDPISTCVSAAMSCSVTTMVLPPPVTPFSLTFRPSDFSVAHAAS